MKTILFVLISLLLTPGSHAGTREGLKAAFDEFNYFTNVEWDQKDKTAYEKEVALFTLRLKRLYAEGLTRQQMLEFLKAEVGDAQLGKDIEAILTQVEINRMTEAEAQQFITDAVKNSTTKGAHWAPAGKVLLIVGGIIVTLFISYVLLVETYEAIGRWVNNWGPEPDCRDEWICREDCFDGSCQEFCMWEVICH